MTAPSENVLICGTSLGSLVLFDLYDYHKITNESINIDALAERNVPTETIEKLIS